VAQASGDFGSFIGGGTVDFTARALFTTTAIFTGDDGFFQGNTPNAQFEVSITYEYVPEPTAMALLGIAGVVTMTFRRRRRAQV
jgi:hypothetical protein